MRNQYYMLLLGQWLVPAAAAVYTGFNYGAFWGTGDNVKKVTDFRDSFNFAKNLSSPVPFDSARLFTCKTAGSENEPTGAFDAAVETKTNLLLGFWISPGTKGAPLHDIIKNEMSALSKGFQKHGQALADLVIGLSVGSEDIHRWEDAGEVGVAATEVTTTIKKVKDSIAASDFAKYMKDKPIGHVDVAKHVVVDGADFYGMTAYPYWSNDSITLGNERFHSTLEGVKQRAGNTPVWIAEMGWPFEGPQRGDAVASAQNLQTFWTEVGCSVVGQYNTFWFELIKDSEANQPDWGMLDSVTHRPRIDLSCPGGPKPNPSAVPASSTAASPSTPPRNQPNSSTPSTLPTPDGQSTTHVTTTIVVTVQPKPSSASAPPADDDAETVHTTVTSTVYVKPSSASSALADRPANLSTNPPPKVTPPHQPTILPVEVPWCVTVAEIAWDGHFVPVDGHPAGPDGKCTPPPAYTGLPYGAPPSQSPPLPPPASAPSSSKIPASVTAPSVASSRSACSKPKSAAPSSSAAPPAPSSAAPSPTPPLTSPSSQALLSSAARLPPASTGVVTSAKPKPPSVTLPEFSLVSGAAAGATAGAKADQEYERKRAWGWW